MLYEVITIEAPDPGTRLPEARVVGGDGEIAHQVQHVAAADAPAGHHGHHRFRQGADEALQISYNFV